jgi:hypothetical protein
LSFDLLKILSLILKTSFFPGYSPAFAAIFFVTNYQGFPVPYLRSYFSLRLFS